VQLFPTGDGSARQVAAHQQATLAAMEGKFETGPRAGLAIIGRPDVQGRKLAHAVQIPGMLSLLAYGSVDATVRGLNDVSRVDWPDNIELLFYAYHLMVALGMAFIGIMGGAAWLLWRGKLHAFRPLLWILALSFPLPYVATTAGWLTSELGRQPWLVYGLMRTAEGSSPNVGSGDVAFSAIGFVCLYLVLGVLFVHLVAREIKRGPGGAEPEAA
jgi:cytochrome bd ubiquinol oxidase subunit I